MAEAGSTVPVPQPEGKWRLRFGAPPQATLATSVRKRFRLDEASTAPADKVAAYEKAVVYLDRIIDRQIIKTGGLLTFNSILLAGFRIGSDHLLTWAKVVNAIGSFVALVTCVALLLLVVRVTWNRSTEYETAETEFSNTVKLLCQRSYTINIFAIVSAIAALGALAECLALLSQ
jgi:hypothetical protein